MAESTCVEDLASLKSVRMKLLSGKLVAEGQYEGRRVRYQQADLASLNQQISALESECGDCTKRRRPLTTSFDHSR